MTASEADVNILIQGIDILCDAENHFLDTFIHDNVLINGKSVTDDQMYDIIRPYRYRRITLS